MRHGTHRATVWILGGTGVVGQNLARMLRAQNLDRIVTVSRRSLPDSTAHLVRDLADPHSDFPCARGDIVVNLTEHTSVAVVSTVIQRGACFIESSASPDYMMAMRNMALSVQGPGYLVDGCGVAPGLTNLMAHQLLQDHPESRTLEIIVDLGLGKHAGQAAMTWFMQSLAQPYTAKVAGDWRVLSPGEMRTRVQWQQAGRPSLAFGFPFAEQQILAEDLKTSCDTVQSFLSLRPQWVTRTVMAFVGTSLGNVMSNQAEQFARLMLQLPAFGPVSTRLQVRGSTRSGRETGRLTLACGDQSEATAAVLATTVRAVGRLGSGRPIRPLADVVTLDQAFGAVRTIHPDATLRATTVMA